MTRRWWVNAALALAIAALGTLLYLKQTPADSGIGLSTLKAADIRRIKIDLPGSAPILLERGSRGWAMSAPIAARVDDFHARRLLEILDAKSKDKFAAGDLARFELDKPKARLTAGGQTFSFGMINPLAGEQYVATQGGVFLVSPAFAAGLPRQPADLVSRRLFADDEQPLALRFKEFSIEQSEGKWISQPAQADLSQDDFNRWIDDWRFAQSTLTDPFNGKPTGDEIKVMLKDGKSIVLRVLQREPGLTLLRTDEGLRYHIPAASARRLLAPPAAGDNKAAAANPPR